MKSRELTATEKARLRYSATVALATEGLAEDRRSARARRGDYGQDWWRGTGHPQQERGRVA